MTKQQNDLLSIEIQKENVTMNKPVYLVLQIVLFYTRKKRHFLWQKMM